MWYSGTRSDLGHIPSIDYQHGQPSVDNGSLKKNFSSDMQQSQHQKGGNSYPGNLRDKITNLHSKDSYHSADAHYYDSRGGGAGTASYAQGYMGSSENSYQRNNSDLRHSVSRPCRDVSETSSSSLKETVSKPFERDLRNVASGSSSVRGSESGGMGKSTWRWNAFSKSNLSGHSRETESGYYQRETDCTGKSSSEYHGKDGHHQKGSCSMDLEDNDFVEDNKGSNPMVEQAGLHSSSNVTVSQMSDYKNYPPSNSTIPQSAPYILDNSTLMMSVNSTPMSISSTALTPHTVASLSSNPQLLPTSGLGMNLQTNLYGGNNIMFLNSLQNGSQSIVSLAPVVMSTPLQIMEATAVSKSGGVALGGSFWDSIKKDGLLSYEKNFAKPPQDSNLLDTTHTVRKDILTPPALGGSFWDSIKKDGLLSYEKNFAKSPHDSNVLDRTHTVGKDIPIPPPPRIPSYKKRSRSRSPSRKSHPSSRRISSDSRRSPGGEKRLRRSISPRERHSRHVREKLPRPSSLTVSKRRRSISPQRERIRSRTPNRILSSGRRKRKRKRGRRKRRCSIMNKFSVHLAGHSVVPECNELGYILGVDVNLVKVEGATFRTFWEDPRFECVRMEPRDLTILFLGDNDISHEISETIRPIDITNKILEIADYCAKVSKTVILYLIQHRSSAPYPLSPDEYNRLRQRINQKLIHAVRSRGNVWVGRISDTFTKLHHTSDGVHFTKFGREAIAQLVRDKIVHAQEASPISLGSNDDDDFGDSVSLDSNDDDDDFGDPISLSSNDDDNNFGDPISIGSTDDDNFGERDLSPRPSSLTVSKRRSISPQRERIRSRTPERIVSSGRSHKQDRSRCSIMNKFTVHLAGHGQVPECNELGYILGTNVNLVRVEGATIRTFWEDPRFECVRTEPSDLTILFLGDNDISEAIQPIDITKKILEIADCCAQVSKTVILYLINLRSSAQHLLSPDDYNHIRRRINKKLTRAVRSRENVWTGHISDTSTKLHHSSDGVHFTKFGREIIAGHVRNRIMKARDNACETSSVSLDSTDDDDYGEKDLSPRPSSLTVSERKSISPRRERIRSRTPDRILNSGRGHKQDRSRCSIMNKFSVHLAGHSIMPECNELGYILGVDVNLVKVEGATVRTFWEDPRFECVRTEPRDLTILFLGDNDIYDTVRPKDITKNILRMVDHCTMVSKSVILYLIQHRSSAPYPLSPDDYNSIRKRINNNLIRSVHSRENVWVGNISDTFTKLHHSSDGVHFNKIGRNAIAEHVRNRILRERDDKACEASPISSGSNDDDDFGEKDLSPMFDEVSLSPGSVKPPSPGTPTPDAVDLQRGLSPVSLEENSFESISGESEREDRSKSPFSDASHGSLIVIDSIEDQDSPQPGGEKASEDLQVHLLRMREEEVELKLKKGEEESLETELRLQNLSPDILDYSPQRDTPSPLLDECEDE